MSIMTPTSVIWAIVPSTCLPMCTLVMGTTGLSGTFVKPMSLTSIFSPSIGPPETSFEISLFRWETRKKPSPSTHLNFFQNLVFTLVFLFWPKCFLYQTSPKKNEVGIYCQCLVRGWFGKSLLQTQLCKIAGQPNNTYGHMALYYNTQGEGPNTSISCWMLPYQAESWQVGYRLL